MEKTTDIESIDGPTAEVMGGDLGTQGFVSEEPPARERFDPVENVADAIIPSKPEGGLWTSTLDENGVTPWLEWCWAERWGLTAESRLYALEPDPCAGVLVIDSARGMYAVLAEYEREDKNDLVSQMFAPLDFEALAEDYDALHVTPDGIAGTRFQHPGMYGWDASSTVWFRWVFEDVRDCGRVGGDREHHVALHGGGA